MSISDQFFITVFSFYKSRYKRKANTIAIFYISLLQISVLLVLGVFFATFFSQLNVETIPSGSAWTLFVMASIVIYFKNWLKYSGKSRKVMNAKMTKNKLKHHNIVLLWVLPLACISLALILFQNFL